MPEKTEAQKKAQKNYMEKFVRVEIRMTPEQRTIVQTHAENHKESMNGFIGRAIAEAMERDGIGTAAPGAAPVERVLVEMPAGVPQRPAETATGAGGILVSPDTLEAAQRAAGRTGESVAAFVARAVAEQGKRDDNAFKMGINPA